MKTLLIATLALTFSAPAAFAKPNYADELNCASQIMPYFRDIADSAGRVAYAAARDGKDGVKLYAITKTSVYAIPTSIKLNQNQGPHFSFAVKLPRHHIHYIQINAEKGGEPTIEMVDLNDFHIPRPEKLTRFRPANLTFAKRFLTDPLLERVRMMSAQVRELRGPFGKIASAQLDDTTLSNWEKFLKESCDQIRVSDLPNDLGQAIDETLAEIATTREFLAEVAKEKCNEQKRAKHAPGGGGSLGGDAGGPSCDTFEPGMVSK